MSKINKNWQIRVFKTHLDPSELSFGPFSDHSKRHSFLPLEFVGFRGFPSKF